MMTTLGAIARWLTFAGILATIGTVAFRFVVIPRAGTSSESRDETLRIAATLGIVASSLIVPAALLRLVIQAAEMRFPDDPWLGISQRLIFSTSWGTTWMVQVVAAVALIGLFVGLRRGAASLWMLTAVAAAILSVTPTLSSHAAAATHRQIVNFGADWLHVLAAGTWIGTLTVLVVAVRVDKGGVRGREQMLNWLAAFSPVALTGASLVALSGLVSSALRMYHLRDFYMTAYGRTLLVKLTAVGIVVLLGWLNWKRNTPTVASSGTTAIRRWMRAELFAAAIVLALTALLVSTSPPMEAM